MVDERFVAHGEPSHEWLDIEEYYEPRAVLPECEGPFKA
jgi:hypothetical protein